MSESDEGAFLEPTTHVRRPLTARLNVPEPAPTIAFFICGLSET